MIVNAFELDGKAFNEKEVVFEESLLDFASSDVGNQKNKKTSNMLLNSDTKSDDNDSDAYAASQGSLVTDQASEVGEGERSDDAAISSEDVIVEDTLFLWFKLVTMSKVYMLWQLSKLRIHFSHCRILLSGLKILQENEATVLL